jgi:ADP-heptose:LPS heptosyltransferase
VHTGFAGISISTNTQSSQWQEGAPMSNWLAAHNILAIRLDNVGDVIMLGPALRAVKETVPDARLSLLASPAGATAAPLLPWIDDVMICRASWQDVGGRIPFDPEREQQLIKVLSERKFDAALIFTSFSQSPHVPGYVCYLAGIPLRAGESKEFSGGTLTTELHSAPDELHQVERNLRLVEHLGFVAKDRQLKIEINEDARATVWKLLSARGLNVADPYIIIHPGASAQARRYPAERFGTLARLLTRRGWPVLLTGVEKEALMIEEIFERAPDAHCIVGTKLAEYSALIEQAALVICNDSLPMHLADALRTPEIVLFSGTDFEEQWRPRATYSRLLRRETACHPCYLFECPIQLACLDISPEEVVEEVETMLENMKVYSAADHSLRAGESR